MIVLLSLLTRKPVWKIVLTFLIVLGIPALIAGILLFQKIRTLCSIREESEGVYYMEYAGNYKLDDMLNAGITSDEEMIEWFRKAEFYGIPVTIHTSVIGCSAFKATTPEGDMLFGRNFDYPETDTLMVYSAPKNGYACSLRKWLNGDFFDSKFSDGEKAAIVTTHNTFTAEDSPYEMECGNETDDKVYLFTYTGSKIVSDDIWGCGIEWWLRSPGKEQDNAVYILGKAADLMGIPQCVSCNLKRNIDDMLIRDRETVCMSPALQRTCNHYCKRRSHFKIQSYWISVLSRKSLTALFSIIE